MKNRQLNVIKVLQQTFQFGLSNKSDIFHSLKYPFLAIFLVYLMSYLTSDISEVFDLLFVIIQIYLYVIFVVQCHRTVLLSKPPEDIKSIFIWKKRDTNFILSTLTLFIIAGVCAVIPSFLVEPIASNFPDSSFSNYWITLSILMIPSGYIFSRLSLMLPAGAIEQDDSILTAWAQSSNNGWQLFLLIGLVPILTGFLQTKIESILPNVYIITGLLNLVILVFEIMILSHCYKELSKTVEEI